MAWSSTSRTRISAARPPTVTPQRRPRASPAHGAGTPYGLILGVPPEFEQRRPTGRTVPPPSRLLDATYSSASAAGGGGAPKRERRVGCLHWWRRQPTRKLERLLDLDRLGRGRV